MNKNGGSGTAMFMMEMIMVVFFFILCASTCILIFVKANQMSGMANDTNRGVVGAESIAEVWKAEGEQGLEERMLAVPAVNSEGQTVSRILWDADWKVSAGAEMAAYQGDVLPVTESDGLAEIRISIERVRDQVTLFELQTKKYAGSGD